MLLEVEEVVKEDMAECKLSLTAMEMSQKKIFEVKISIRNLNFIINPQSIDLSPLKSYL
jgi:hypothetical protein